MNTHILSKGFKLQGIHVPIFELTPGTILALYWPMPFGSRSEQLLYDLLSRKSSNPALSVNDVVAVVNQNGSDFLSSSFDRNDFDKSFYEYVADAGMNM
jgi:hypothetical protein